LDPLLVKVKFFFLGDGLRIRGNLPSIARIADLDHTEHRPSQGFKHWVAGPQRKIIFGVPQVAQESAESVFSTSRRKEWRTVFISLPREATDVVGSFFRAHIAPIAHVAFSIS
jgi:hypothetical protein